MYIPTDGRTFPPLVILGRLKEVHLKRPLNGYCASSSRPEASMWLDHHYLALKCQEQGKIPDVWNTRHMVESRRHSLFLYEIKYDVVQFICSTAQSKADTFNILTLTSPKKSYSSITNECC